MTADDVVRRPDSYLRVAGAVPSVVVGDVAGNADRIIELYRRAVGESVALVAFPELSLCGYTIADLVHHDAVLDACRSGLDRIADATRGQRSVAVVGLPWRAAGKLYNVAAAVADGRVVTVVAKRFIPNTGEFYEQRWFASGAELPEDALGPRLIDIGGVVVGIEVCEDLWAPRPPSTDLALAGARVVVNLSASNELLGKHEWRRTLVRSQSGRTMGGYVYVSAGVGESVADTVFGGDAFIAENGTVLAEGRRFSREPELVVADLDIAALDFERRRNMTFRPSAHDAIEAPVEVGPGPTVTDAGDLRRVTDPHPFVPDDRDDRRQRCEEILAIQSAGLQSAMVSARSQRLVLGLSGGLDSTLAALVAVEVLDRRGLDRSNLVALVMPGEASSERTQTNARRLAEELGATCRVVPIDKLSASALEAIGHDGMTEDITYENTQARMRTLLLFNTANAENGLVVGTGDMSELAVGWCTFNGDHMSSYNVNVGVPKTLVRHLVSTAAGWPEFSPVAALLADIVDTPISPELTSGGASGTVSQRTEDVVGPYELIDFFLYRLIRHGDSPQRIAFLAGRAFDGVYDATTLARWLDEFLVRFTRNQFKRDALPNGPKVGTVALSPRGDWRMSPQTGAWYRPGE